MGTNIEGYDYGTTYQVPIPTISRKLKDRIQKLTGEEPFITFVKLPLREKHDRTIVTNYKIITSGDSYKYFREGSDGEIIMHSHGDWLTITSLIDIDALKNTDAFLIDLQKIIDEAKKRVMDIRGDKRCNFLTF